MKKQILFISSLMVFILISNPAFSQKKGIGLGAILNSPTGISFKGWVDDHLAVDGAVSFTIGDNSDFYVHADVLADRDLKNEDVNVDPGLFHLYYGGGVRLYWQEITDDVQVGIRIPGGISYTPTDIPAELFFELVPTLDVAPDVQFGFAGAVGARYYID